MVDSQRPVTATGRIFLNLMDRQKITLKLEGHLPRYATFVGRIKHIAPVDEDGVKYWLGSTVVGGQAVVVRSWQSKAWDGFRLWYAPLNVLQCEAIIDDHDAVLPAPLQNIVSAVNK